MTHYTLLKLVALYWMEYYVKFNKKKTDSVKLQLRSFYFESFNFSVILLLKFFLLIISPCNFVFYLHGSSFSPDVGNYFIHMESIFWKRSNFFVTSLLLEELKIWTVCLWRLPFLFSSDDLHGCFTIIYPLRGCSLKVT